jgi:CheY-like chemotaxis protein
MTQNSQSGGIAETADQTILVVEDGEAVRKMICSMLSQNGYQCVEAADGEQALVLLEGIRSVDLVLTDLMMPGMSGTELAKHISKEYPQIRIIFMSGYCDDPVIRTPDAGSGWFLAKPFTASTLAESVRRALDRPWKGLPALCLRS